MKRLFFILALVLCGAMEAAAQDTLDCMKGMVAGYMYDSSCWARLGDGIRFGSFAGPGAGGEYAMRFLVDDSVTVYGIAAGIGDMAARSYFIIYDLSYTNSIEYLRLYSHQSDTLSCLAQTPVHLRTTPVSYYFHIELSSDYNPPDSYKYTAMYERYFNSPVTVCDSFYAGLTYLIPRFYRDSNNNYWEFACPPLSLTTIEGNPYYYSPWCICTSIHHNDDGSTYTHFSPPTRDPWYPMVFPLLLPPDTTAVGNGAVVSGDSVIVTDTVIVGGDTVVYYDTVYAGDILVGSDTVAMGDTLVVTDTLVIGGDTIVTCDTLLAVVQADMLARLTGVMPNPASTTAKVVSSFGLTRIEVYSSTGARVYDRPAVGLAATLDVSRWPSGTYLLRIHTPMGVATKRLAVAR